MCSSQQFYLNARNIFLTCFATIWLTACGGSEKIELSSNKNVKDAVDAATGPLEDLNIKKRDIPEMLQTAALNPYATPQFTKCTAVREEIAKLDELLGADMEPREVEVASAGGLAGLTDVKIPTQEQVEDGVGNLAKDAVLGAIRGHTNIIPFRGIVRTITGANRYQKKVTQAYEAGKLRRAYLKGYAQEKFGTSCLSMPLAAKVTVEGDETAATPDGEKPSE